MDAYRIALFVHILGGIGLFAAFAFEWVATARLRRSSTRDQVITWLGVRSLVQRLGPLSMALVLAPGLTMTAVRWTFIGWPGVALIKTDQWGGDRCRWRA